MTAVTRDASVANDPQRARRLYEAVEASTVGGELTKRVYHLGKPHFTDGVRTACIAVGADEHVLFLFNRNFFDGLAGTPLVFVLLHEALHLALAHHQRQGQRIAAVWNISCDLVVNQFLLHQVGFCTGSSAQWADFIATAITFENLGLAGGLQARDMTAEQVYGLLLTNLPKLHKQYGQVRACDEHAWAQEAGENSGQSTSPPSVDRAPAKLGPHDRHKDEEQADERRQVELDGFGRQIKDIFRLWMPGWSPDGAGELREVLKVAPPVVDWERILRQRIEHCLHSGYEQRWAPPNRKIAWLYPNVLLPAELDLERLRPSVLLAIDASGSVSQDGLSKLLAVARSIPPDRAQVSAIIFDTIIHELDLEAELTSVPGGGGTSFQCIEDHARRLKKYPSLIAVLTDGLAPAPQVLHSNRWFWLITETGSSERIESVGAHCQIADTALAVSERASLTTRTTPYAPDLPANQCRGPLEPQGGRHGDQLQRYLAQDPRVPAVPRQDSRSDPRHSGRGQSGVSHCPIHVQSHPMGLEPCSFISLVGDSHVADSAVRSRHAAGDTGAGDPPGAAVPHARWPSMGEALDQQHGPGPGRLNPDL